MSCRPVYHPRFGDLSLLDAVNISGKASLSDEIFKEEESLMIHLTVTGRCYAQCKGCVNSAITLGSNEPRSSLITFQESEPERDAAIIMDLARRCKDSLITVCFYGGEPFLAIEEMEKVWSLLSQSKIGDRFRYMVYTNGELLIDALNRYPEFMKEIWLTSISIDGDEEQHERVRQGTNFTEIIRNLKELSGRSKGHILHWSTLREEQSLLTCFEEFMRLYEEGLVNHFFWHWAENKEAFEDLQSYVQKYGQELEKVMDIYVERLSKGELLSIVHLNELILYLITGKERGHTACGVELAQNYDIVSGKVYACADLPSPSSLGELKNGHLSLNEYDLNSLVSYKEWLGCQKCGVHPYCGGRCPVQFLAGTPERTHQYCQLMRLHVGIVQERIEEIATCLGKNRISFQEIYDRSAFLAKYTDVVP